MARAIPLPGDVLDRLIRAAIEDPAQALAKVGFATITIAVDAAAAALQQGGGRHWWLVLQQLLLGACFVGGAGAIWASFWVRGDADRRRATGQVLLAVAVVNLLVAIVLSGFDPQIAVNVLGDML